MRVPSNVPLVLSYDERGRRMECAHPIQVGGLCAICGKDLEAYVLVPRVDRG